MAGELDTPGMVTIIHVSGHTQPSFSNPVPWLAGLRRRFRAQTGVGLLAFLPEAYDMCPRPEQSGPSLALTVGELGGRFDMMAAG